MLEHFVAVLCCAGISEFIDTALDAGAAVGIVAGTCSIPEEQILTAALFALGEKRSEKLHTFVCSPQQQQQADGQQNSFDGLTLEQSMAAARARVCPLCNPDLRLCHTRSWTCPFYESLV